VRDREREGKKVLGRRSNKVEVKEGKVWGRARKQDGEPQHMTTGTV
jgi:hypothetical protein